MLAAQDINPECLFLIKDSDVTSIPEIWWKQDK